MKIKKTVRMTIFFIVFMCSCSVGPQPIAYGTDHCANCEMVIVDKRFGAEIVTEKGKAYKFDSVECLVEFLKKDKMGQEQEKLLLVTPFDKPETFVDAYQGRFLQSKQLPSPMGMFLTAFKDDATVNEFRTKYGGRIMSWTELWAQFDQMQ